MLCPRCSVAEFSAETHTCGWCGYSSGGVALSLDAGDELEEVARRELGGLFQIEEVLAQRARSIVLAARDPETGQRVAVRVLPRTALGEAGLENRLVGVLAAASALDHPHIVTVHRSGTTAGTVWYSMQLVEGRSLAEVLREHGPFELRACLRIAEQVASALHYAHRRGIMHGDVRPANILLDRHDWALLSDFMIGRVLDSVPPFGPDVGPARPPEYVAPEEARERKPAPAADQYALATTIYQCLTGCLPSAGDSPEVSPDAPPPPAGEARPDLPPHVAATLWRALSPHPEDRFLTVLELMSALSAAEAGPGFLLPPPARPAAIANQAVLFVDQPPRPNRWPKMAGGLVLMAVVGVVLVELLRTEPGQLPNPLAQLTGPAPPSAAVPPASPAPAPGTPVLPVDSSGWATRVERETVVAPHPARGEPRPARGAKQPRPRSSFGAARAPSPRVLAVQPKRRVAPPPLDTPTSPPPSREPGHLFISSRPWGLLYLDGQLVGNTPQASFPIPPGMHRIRIVRDGFRPVERWIVVTPEQEIRLIDIVLEEQAR